MSATTAERVIYAAKSRKWNSTQNPKFPTEFPDEHAANLEWIRKAEEEAARQHLQHVQAEILKSQTRNSSTGDARAKKESGTRKWIMIGVIGVLVALRAWQRYKQHIIE